MQTIETQRRAPVIVANADAFTETLFKPIEGRTADGYVVKRSKRFCDVWLNGTIYRINGELVWCAPCTFSDGRKGWTYSNLPFSLMGLDDAARALVVSSEWVNGSVRRFFA